MDAGQRIYIKRPGDKTTSFTAKELHCTHADMKTFTCCMLLAAAALCSAAPPERQTTSGQARAADVYDVLYIVPRPDLSSLGPADTDASTDGTGFGGSGSFSINLFGLLKGALSAAGGIGAGLRKGSTGTA